MMYSHQCPKCNNTYQDEDPDVYYCASCISERKEIAAKIDAQFGSRPRVQVKSDLQIFDEQAVEMNVGGRVIRVNRA